MRIGVVALLALLVCCAGCRRDRYEIVVVGKGQAYRLDKDTGEVHYLEGDEARRVSFREASREDPEPAVPREPRNWIDSALLESTSDVLVTDSPSK
jgi:hypothetical protein